MSTYLISRTYRNSLFDVVAARAYVDEVHTKLLHLTHVYFALLKAPISPFAVLVLLRALSPVSSADAHEQRLLPGFAYTFYDLQGEPQAVFKRTAVLIGPVVGQR